MKTESLSVGRAGYVPVSLGKVGEAQATRIDIDVREWDEAYPGATYLLFVSPPEPTAPYLAKVTHENGVVSWVLESEDTTTAGNGTIELILTQGNARIKSVTWSTMMMTSPSSSEAGDAPQSHPTWWEDALEKIEDAKQEAIREIDGTFDSEVAEGKAALEASGAAQQVAIQQKGEQTLASIPEEYVDLDASVKLLKDQKAPVIRETSQGDGVIAVSDSAEHPLLGLKLFGKTTQDGTPTPEAPVPLVSVGDSGTIGVQAAGKNLFDGKIGNYGIGTSGSGISGNRVLISNHYRGFACMIAPGKSYTVSRDSISTSRFRTGFTMEYPAANVPVYKLINSDDLLKKTVTAPEGCHYLVCYLSNTSEDTSGIKYQVEEGEVATPFEPYKDGGTLTAQTPGGLPGIPVTSGGNYTDASGQQWVCDEVDFARGVYTRRIGRIDSYAGENVGAVYMSTTGALTNGATVLYLIDTSVETLLPDAELAQYAAMMSQYPNTTVINDAGAGMAITYGADTKNYIDNKIAAISAALIGGN